MDPITLTLLALLLGAGTITIALLTSGVVHKFVASRAARFGTAEIIRKRLSTGRYEVIVGVFNPAGNKIASRRWNTATIDNELNTEFGDGDVIEIRT